MTPNARTRNKLKEYGIVCDTSEHWNPFSRTRKDLFNFLDLVALDGSKIIGIQSTSGSNHSARCKKIRDNQFAKLWLQGGGIIQVWSWLKKNNRWTERVSKAYLLEDQVTFCDT